MPQNAAMLSLGPYELLDIILMDIGDSFNNAGICCLHEAVYTSQRYSVHKKVWIISSRTRGK